MTFHKNNIFSDSLCLGLKIQGGQNHKTSSVTNFSCSYCTKTNRLSLNFSSNFLLKIYTLPNMDDPVKSRDIPFLNFGAKMHDLGSDIWGKKSFLIST